MQTGLDAVKYGLNHHLKHRNPDEDLPNNFEEDKEVYFDELSLSLDGDVFIEQLKQRHTNA